MPIYGYICEACGDKFEMIRCVNEKDYPLNFKVCASNKTHRTLSKVGTMIGTDHGSRTSGGHSCKGCSSGNCGSCHH
ncbi:MAG: hypothetical protein JXA19_02770 [Anaerolineales bacterium]|nr:hypothetical protein [Anaerolineales bacterium]